MKKREKIQLLRLKDVMAKTGLSRAMIYNMTTRGQFPAKVQLSDKAIAWIEEEIDEWIEGRVKITKYSKEKDAG